MTDHTAQIRRFIARFSQRGFVRAEDGATAVEFGLLALPFFTLIGAILETVLVFFGSQVLDSAVDQSVRLVRTGQAQQAEPPLTGATFRDHICTYTYGLFDCSQIKVNVKTIVSFTAAATLDPIDPDTGEWLFAETYNPGISSSIVMVEAYYKWPTILDINGFNLASTADGKRLMAAVRVFRNEPF